VDPLETGCGAEAFGSGAAGADGFTATCGDSACGAGGAAVDGFAVTCGAGAAEVDPLETGCGAEVFGSGAAGADGRAGACGADACGADACGADACGADACETGACETGACETGACGAGAAGAGLAGVSAAELADAAAPDAACVAALTGLVPSARASAIAKNPKSAKTVAATTPSRFRLAPDRQRAAPHLQETPANKPRSTLSNQNPDKPSYQRTGVILPGSSQAKPQNPARDRKSSPKRPALVVAGMRARAAGAGATTLNRPPDVAMDLGLV
jgi:hypothetical protein